MPSKTTPPAAECARQYGRNDVDYESFYPAWDKQLALSMTAAAIVKDLKRCECEIERACESHHRAIQATTSMQSQSQRRAQSRNSVDGASQRRSALWGALEIHELFPEHAHGGGIPPESKTRP